MYSITRICDNTLEHSERIMFKMDDITNFDYCPICGNRLKSLKESLTDFSNYTGKLQGTIKYYTNIHPRNSKVKENESIDVSNSKQMVKRHAPNMFFTVEEFVEPLINRLRPSNGKTTRQTFNEIGNGRVLGYLSRAYGRDNLERFIDLCDKLGFDNVILDIADKNIKTTGRFRKYLDSFNIDNA